MAFHTSMFFFNKSLKDLNKAVVNTFKIICIRRKMSFLVTVAGKSNFTVKSSV